MRGAVQLRVLGLGAEGQMGRAQRLLQRGARDGLATVIDVRPPEEYAQGHLAGAVNIPLERLEEHLARLPLEREVIAYCRGPWCVLSFEAVARLREAGFAARRLCDGLPEWRRAGFPMAGDQSTSRSR